MTLGEEAARGMRGAWLLLRRDAQASAWFNHSQQGYWRSFFAAILLLPLYVAYHSAAEVPPGAENVAPARRWAVEAIGYALAWTSWPLLAFYLTRALDCGDRYLGYIVAYNWAQMLTAPLLITVSVLLRPVLPQAAWMLLYLLALAGVLAFEYLIARQMLEISPPRALALEGAVFTLSLVLREITEFAMTAGPAE
jgi:hypothetical protein